MDKPFIVDYSEKAIAVFGNTVSLKDALEEVGGKYNTNLRGKAGWIFPKMKREIVQKLLQISPPAAAGRAEDDYERPKRLLTATKATAPLREEALPRLLKRPVTMDEYELAIQRLESITEKLIKVTETLSNKK